MAEGSVRSGVGVCTTRIQVSSLGDDVEDINETLLYSIENYGCTNRLSDSVDARLSSSCFPNSGT